MIRGLGPRRLSAPDQPVGRWLVARYVRAIVELCRTLELDTVAEGIEIHEQATRLTELGCEMAQGFHFGRPMTARDLARRLASWASREPIAAGEQQAFG